MEVPSQDSLHLRLQRCIEVSRHPTLIGLDRIKVEPQDEKTWNLQVYFVPAAPSQSHKEWLPTNLTPANFKITTVTGETAPIEVRSATPNTTYIQLEIALSTLNYGESYSIFYRLILVDFEAVDPNLSHIGFYLNEILEIDPQSPTDLPPPLQLPIEINYLAKDYQSFRQLMLELSNVTTA